MVTQGLVGSAFPLASLAITETPYLRATGGW